MTAEALNLVYGDNKLLQRSDKNIFQTVNKDDTPTHTHSFKIRYKIQSYSSERLLPLFH